jgi:hypothetical protein
MRAKPAVRPARMTTKLAVRMSVKNAKRLATIVSKLAKRVSMIRVVD